MKIPEPSVDNIETPALCRRHVRTIDNILSSRRLLLSDLLIKLELEQNSGIVNWPAPMIDALKGINGS